MEEAGVPRKRLRGREEEEEEPWSCGGGRGV